MAGHSLNDDKVRTADAIIDRSLLFEEMALSEPVKQALARNHFIHPSPIQARAIPLARCDFDLLVQAKSGTGKTLVFAISIVERHDPEVAFPQSLTIVPAREIAVQVESVLNRIGSDLGNFKARSFIGGMEISVDRKNLQNCSAIVGTPGRILHLIKSNVLNTSYIRTLVMDEADTLLQASMRGDIDKIVAALPEKRQTIVCSATFYNNRDRELLRYMNAKFIGVTPKREVPLLFGIKQFVRELPAEPDNVKDLMAKVGVLNEIFQQIQFAQCVVFANTIAKAETYCTYLKKAGWAAEVINSSMEQRFRLKAIEDFRSFRARVLIATNLISRGIDVENVNLVINADVPKDNATYLHRIGRAGRFGTKGIAVTLVSGVKDMERFRRILHDIGGNEMFVLKLPQGQLENVWHFEAYGDRYEKLFASQMVQEIRDKDADQLFLKAMKMIGDELKNNGDGGEPSARSNNNDDGKMDDSLEKSTSDEETVVELVDAPNAMLEKATNGHAVELNGNVSESVAASTVAMDGLSMSMEKLSLDRGLQPNGDRGAKTKRLDSLNGNQKKPDVNERLEEMDNDANNDNDDDDDDGDEDNDSPKPGPSKNGVKPVPSSQAATLRGNLSTPVPDIDGTQLLLLKGSTITTIVTRNGGDESDLESSSSLSTNVTEKVEVGSDFNAQMSRLNQIPDPRFRQIGSVDCSDIDHSSDSEANGGECPPFEANNDALFAKIMEQKELGVEHPEHQVQLHSIDGCSLEVHDDTISDRGLTRKCSVPDVVPCGISLDASRLNHRGVLAEEIGENGEEGEEIELNSNTCGSNRGSLFEEEVEDVIQANLPNRIRFQQQDSLEVNSNTVGSNVGSTPEPPEMLDQQSLPIINPIEADPIGPIGPECAAHDVDDMMDDASSYSSYDSDASNSSFFDDVDRVSVASAKSTPKENDALASADPLMGGVAAVAGPSGSLEQIGAVPSNSVSVAASPHLFAVPSIPTPPLLVSGIIPPVASGTVVGGVNPPPVQPIIDEERSTRSPAFMARMENLLPPFLPTMAPGVAAGGAGASTTAPPMRSDAHATTLYHRTYALWSNQYWNQLTQINDYVRFASYARRNAYRSP
ncbi:probable ATP-dependent RNA helicase DDX20 [Anopheles maculipalpis]|uniref:probable ATP-dependent RNA helicase DDX20 n=1 Tax=Anopheles maculipalpis TaxID=1496333 RepID=UPI002158C74C|nr:probable ATP-dependent RNA helicase DDX20 [Anopheles maculipalpis]